MSEFLPAPLAKDPHYEALEKLLERSLKLDLTRLLIYWLDMVEASALPHLAQQLHILGLEGWDYAVTESQKRELLKQAVELHRYKGTPWAVRQGLKRIDPNLDIEEWFQYGGEPFYFRLTGPQKLTLAQAVKLFNTLEALKSLRSKLEGGIEALDELALELNWASHQLLQILKESSVRAVRNLGAVLLMGGVTRLESSLAPQPLDRSPQVQPVALRVGTSTRIEVSCR